METIPGLIPIKCDAFLEEDMRIFDLEKTVKKAVKIQTSDGYPFWRIDGQWTNGDMCWGDDNALLVAVMRGDMDFLVWFEGHKPKSVEELYDRDFD